MRETTNRNGRSLLLLSMPRAEALAQQILLEVDEMLPHSSLMDAVAWYSFPSGNLGKDSTGHGNDLGLFGTTGFPVPSLGPDYQPATLLTSASAQYFKSPNAVGQTGVTDLSVLLMVNFTSLSPGTQRLVMFRGVSTNPTSIGTTSSGDQVSIAVNGSTVIATSAGFLAGIWYFWYVEYLKASRLVNVTVRQSGAVAQAFSGTSAAMSTDYTRLVIGGDTAAQFADASMANVGIYDRTLSIPEQDEYFNNGRGITWPGDERISIIRG